MQLAGVIRVAVSCLYSTKFCLRNRHCKNVYPPKEVSTSKNPKLCSFTKLEPAVPLRLYSWLMAPACLELGPQVKVLPSGYHFGESAFQVSFERHFPLQPRYNLFLFTSPWSYCSNYLATKRASCLHVSSPLHPLNSCQRGFLKRGTVLLKIPQRLAGSAQAVPFTVWPQKSLPHRLFRLEQNQTISSPPKLQPDTL